MTTMDNMTTDTEPFSLSLERRGLSLKRAKLMTLQVNTGLLCNLACRHCHLEAGPARKEMMSAATVQQVLAFARRFPFTVIDVTGGAPEMNPHILDLLGGLAELTPRLLLRSNLVAMSGALREKLVEFCCAAKVVIIASFPALNEAQAEAQRGKGVFSKSLEVLRYLNGQGYGQVDSGLELDLVSNPAGAFMPANQEAQAHRFHELLHSKWGVIFNNLYSFANAPLGRFERWLRQQGNYQGYLAKLAQNFNATSLDGVMCRRLISVAWDGYLYDCDFNQAAGLPLGRVPTHISKLDILPGPGDAIAIADHCYACTAGGGFT
ncbi:MAG: radical SAM/Cys-rich domain protein [Deltaproteobacteria bacterium]|nr:radical SAM/Cys-rich domain protein [Deltaproteobacteria bacterium]